MQSTSPCDLSPSTPSIARPNWLHLDLKGAIPAFDQMLAWLDALAGCGFNGLMWEYEDRFDWQAFPGVARSPYTHAQWRAIWRRCRELNLTVTPLVQTQGHLEWLLKHEAYAGWREAGFYNELCPQNRSAVDHITQFLDEVIDLHPDSAFIHIGGDETWNLCSCPACQDQAASHPDGKMSVYMSHVGQMCRHVLSRGKRPMIWADMFWRENRLDLARQLPPQTILVDWQYNGVAPFATTEMLRPSGLELWGASAVRRSHDTTTLQASLDATIDNILSWNRQAERGQVAGMIHTTWGRSRSLMPLYGPWEGWLPCFIAAGRRDAWTNHPLDVPARLLHRVMSQPPGSPEVVREAQALMALASREPQAKDQPLEQACLRWWALAVEHHQLRGRIMGFVANEHAMQAVDEHVGMAPEIIVRRTNARSSLNALLDDLEGRVRQFWNDRQLTDVEEYIDSRVSNLRRCLAASDPQPAVAACPTAG